MKTGFIGSLKTGQFYLFKKKLKNLKKQKWKKLSNKLEKLSDKPENQLVYRFSFKI
jgi:hypothetical protein